MSSPVIGESRENTGLLSSTHSVRPDPGHFVETSIASKIPVGIEFGNYHLESIVHGVWLSCSHDQRPDTIKSEHGPKHGLNPYLWTRMIGNPRPKQTAGD